MSWTVHDIPHQTGKVVLITGANSGIGYESAVALARKGAHIVMACRNMTKAERARRDLLARAPGASVDVLALDLSSLDSVHRFASNFRTAYRRLDVLMNNAGIMTPPYGKTVDGFETQFGTNHLGHFALTGLLLPVLLKTPHSRVVTVSSAAYLLSRGIRFDDLQSEKRYHPWAAYSQSKLANLLFALELQRRLETIEVDTISVASHPGYARTGLQHPPQHGLGHWWSTAFASVASQSAYEGARYQVYAAAAPDVHGGDFYGPAQILVGNVELTNVVGQGRNLNAAARLWAVSENLTGVHFDLPVRRVSAPVAVPA